MKEHLSMNMWTKCKIDILKKRQKYSFLSAQKGHVLRYLRGFRPFSEFQILSDLGRQKVFKGHFLRY